MNSLELVRFLQNKEEHYPISDEFIEQYQQKDNGDKNSYITHAKNTGHIVDAKQHEPNQKWHLLESYYIERLIEEEEADFLIRGFNCPELLLWMAEAANVDKDIVKEASGYAKDKIDRLRKEIPSKSYSREAVQYMNKMLNEKYGKNLWVMIVEMIK